MQALRKLEPITITLFLAIAFGFGVRQFVKNTNVFSLLDSGSASSALVEAAIPNTPANEISYLKLFLQNKYDARVLQINNTFDEKTQVLLMKYQLDNGLPQTGVLDNETRTLIQSELKKN